MNKFGRFITLDGVDCAGKSTAIRKLVETLEKEKGVPVEQTFEPGGTMLSMAIREIVLSGQFADEPTAETTMLLMFAARKQNLHYRISPALGQNKYVICDRWNASTFAYQVKDFKTSRLFQSLVKSIEIEPISFILDIDYETYEERIQDRGEELDNIEKLNAGQNRFKALREKYLNYARNYNSIVIDATGDTQSIVDQIMDHLR